MEPVAKLIEWERGRFVISNTGHGIGGGAVKGADKDAEMGKQELIGVREAARAPSSVPCQKRDIPHLTVAAP